MTVLIPWPACKLFVADRSCIGAITQKRTTSMTWIVVLEIEPYGDRFRLFAVIVPRVAMVYRVVWRVEALKLN